MKDPKDKQTIDAFEKKAMTGAERQAKNRAAMKDRVRLDCYISKKHKDMLNTMCEEKEIYRVIELLIEEAYIEIN